MACYARKRSSAAQTRNTAGFRLWSSPDAIVQTVAGSKQSMTPLPHGRCRTNVWLRLDSPFRRLARACPCADFFETSVDSCRLKKYKIELDAVFGARDRPQRPPAPLRRECRRPVAARPRPPHAGGGVLAPDDLHPVGDEEWQEDGRQRVVVDGECPRRDGNAGKRERERKNTQLAFAERLLLVRFVSLAKAAV